MKKKVEKNRVRVPLSYYIDNSEFEGDLNKIIKFLQELPAKVKEHYKQAYPQNIIINSVEIFEIEINTGYGDSSDEFEVVGWRWETNEEYNRRIEINKKNAITAKKLAKEKKLRQEQDELVLLARLLEKHKGYAGK